MTRINTVPVKELCNKHLFAEYRELPRVLRRAILAIYKGKNPSDIKISPEYLLGKGHELFFINKCEWLYKRWLELKQELENRDYNLGEQFQIIVKSRAKYIRKKGKQFYGTYQPTKASMLINRQRIQERLNA